MITQSAKRNHKWNWRLMVLFAAFMTHVISDGIVYSFGIFYAEFVHLSGCSREEAAWVVSIMCGTLNLVGPLAGALTNKYDCRFVCVIGSLLATSGFAFSFLASSVRQLYFTVGLCSGAGIGLMYLPAIVSVSRYFEKNRAFATGVAASGSGIGTFILAPVLERLISEFGWRGAILIASGILLNGCVFGALFRPIYQPKDEQVQLSLHCNLRDKIVSPIRSFSLPVLHNYPCFSSLTDIQTNCNCKSDPMDLHATHEDIIPLRNVPVEFATTSFEKTSIRPKFLTRGLDLKIFQDPVFIIFLFSNLLTSLAFETTTVYLIERTIEKRIALKEEASFLISILGISNTIGRITFGYISDRIHRYRVWIYTGSLAVCGLSTGLSCLCFNYAHMATFSAIFGLTAGAYAALLPVVLVDLLGIERLTDTFGFLLCFQGVASFFGPPITGWLYDRTKSFDAGYLFSATSMLAGSLMMFAFIFCNLKRIP